MASLRTHRDYEPDYVFRVLGSPHLYARAAEMRWAQETARRLEELHRHRPHSGA